MRWLALKLIRAYQILFSPLMVPACRFTPTCSHYAREVITKHGVWRGSWLTIKRLLRCHPWHPGGYDPAP